MSSDTNTKQFKSDLKNGDYVRPASLEDLNRIQEITDVVNISYLSGGKKKITCTIL